MKILGIETSCDETAVCVVEAKGGLENPSFKVLGDALYSQAHTHAEYGGVFPSLAKREHARNLVPLLEKALRDANLKTSPAFQAPPSKGDPASAEVSNNSNKRYLPSEGRPQVCRNMRGTSGRRPRDVLLRQGIYEDIKKILERETGLFEMTKELLEKIEKPDIDYISVTAGPGLEPALWVGISFAKALGLAWNIPVIPANHMEGHIISPLLGKEKLEVVFPVIALLISGGHTELVLMKNWRERKVIGKTRDDAVGEAFDKVARLLSLPYPGGPHISRLAEEARTAHTTPSVKLPRPMLKTPDYDFSFSGIKTAVLYVVKKLLPREGRPGGVVFNTTSPNPSSREGVPSRADDELSHETKIGIALEFENAVTEVLVAKTRKALEEHNAKTLILGGGVVANIHIRKSFKKMAEEYGDIALLVPDTAHSTDNALMIAAAGYLSILSGSNPDKDFKAQGNLSL